MNMYNNLEDAVEQAKSCIDSDYGRICNMLAISDIETRKFVDRVLEWYSDKKNRCQWLYVMFEPSGALKVQEPTQFLASLASFVGNCLLDDSSFLIEWRKYHFTENHSNIFDNSERGFVTDLTTEDDPKSWPCVVAYPSNDNGSTDAAELLHAMDIMEQREKENSLDDE